MNDKLKADFDKVVKKRKAQGEDNFIGKNERIAAHRERISTHGDCDICGCHSTMLVHGVCQKAACQRRIEEGKVDLDWYNEEA